MSFLEYYSKQISTQKSQIKNKGNPNNSQQSTIHPPTNNILPSSLTMSTQINTPSARSYASIFRSLTEVQVNPPVIDHQRMSPSFQTVSKQSEIDTISSIPQSQIYSNRETYHPIKFRQMHVFDFANNFQSEVCISIIDDFNKNQKERLVINKNHFQMFAETIRNQPNPSKVITKSMVEDEKQMVVQKVDAEINTSYHQDNPDKKSHQIDMSKDLLNKDISKSMDKPLEQSLEKQQSSILPQPNKQKTEMPHLQLLKMEIQNQKSRIPRSYDYLEIMETKLMEFLKYLVENQGDVKLKGTNEEKIKSVLDNIAFYKGKKVNGELKVVLLQYFFSEIKELKSYKEQVIRNRIKGDDFPHPKPSQKQRGQNGAIKIDERPPQLIDLSKQVEEQRRQKLKAKKGANEKTIPKKVEPKKYANKLPEVPKRTPVKKSTKNNASLSAIKNVQQEDESNWMGPTLNF